MIDLMKSAIAWQEQALELQRQQVALAQRWMGAGQDMIAAQRQGAAALDASAKAWRSWLDLWTAKP